MRLNLGCGRHVLAGWFNVDAQASPKAVRPPDLLSDVKKTDLPDGCASEVMAIHLFEHLYRWECDEAIEEWKRLLQPGGQLTLEMPDLWKYCRNIVEELKNDKHPDQLGMWGMFGDPRERDPFMCHRWGWTFKTIRPFLAEHGFVDIVEGPTEWHRAGRAKRDFRVTARKG
jgi:predicted SAM-dependent methyltransferase